MTHNQTPIFWLIPPENINQNIPIAIVNVNGITSISINLNQRQAIGTIIDNPTQETVGINKFLLNKSCK
jgi:hypothetical protein